METPNRDALERVGDRPFLFSFAKSGKSGVGEEPEESLSAAAAALHEGTDSEGEEGAEPGGANLGEANKLGHSSHKLALALRGGRHGKPLSLNHPELCVEVKLKTNKKHEKACPAPSDPPPFFRTRISPCYPCRAETGPCFVPGSPHAVARSRRRASAGPTS